MLKRVLGSSLTKKAVLAGVVLLGGIHCKAGKENATETPSSVEGSRAALGVSPGSWLQLDTTIGHGTGDAWLLPDESATQRQHGTASGAAQSVVTHPTNPNIVYIAAVSGGVWKTENALSKSPTWRPLTDSLPWLWSATLAMDPNHPDTLVAGVGWFTAGAFLDVVPWPAGRSAGLIYVTTNGGNDWTVRYDLKDKQVSALDVRDNRVLAGTSDDGLFLGTTSGGFSRVTNGLPSSNGHVFSLAPMGGDGNTLYAAIGPSPTGTCSPTSCLGTEGGIFITTNGGTSWSNVSSSNGRLRKALSYCPPTGGCSVNNILLSAAGSGRVYVGVVLQDGAPDLSWLGRTDDHGATWVEMDLPRTPIQQYWPWNPSVIKYHGNIKAIHPSASLPALEITTDVPHQMFEDGSYAKRTVLIKGVTGMANVNRDWFVAPLDSTKFLAYDLATRDWTSDGTSCDDSSTPCGGTWQSWSGAGAQMVSMTADPAYQNLLYVAGTGCAPFYTPASAPGYCDWGPYTLLVRGDATVVAAKDVPSAGWTPVVGTGTDSITSPHTDPRCFAFDAAGGMYQTSDGGVVRHTNPRGLPFSGGVGPLGDWIDKNGNLSTIQIRDIAIDTRSGLAFGGTQDNGTIDQMPTDLQWRDFTGGDGGDVEVDDRFLNVSYRYHGTQRKAFDATGTYDGSLEYNLPLKILDPSTGEPTNDSLSSFAPFMVNKSDGAPDVDHSHLVFGGADHVYESLDGGATVRKVGTETGQAIALAYGHAGCPNDYKDSLWVIGWGRSPSTFVRLAADAPLTPTANQLPPASSGDIALDPQSCRMAYALAGEQVYMTTNAGDTPWKNITGDLEKLKTGILHSIQYVPSAAGDRIFVAGSIGVYMASTANPGVWVRAGTGLPNAIPRDLDYDPVHHKLVVATFGRGTFALANPESINQAPVAHCKDIILPAGPSCSATPTPNTFDNGSVDPDGNPLTFTGVDPTTLENTPLGPFPPGPHGVTINVADNQGASALCSQTITVVDDTPPGLQIPSDKTVRTCANSTAVFIGQATATDNCSTSLVPTGQVISKNGVTLPTPIPVTNGQATLGLGTYVVRWTASDGTNSAVPANQTVTVAPPMQTSQSFTMDDRAQLSGAGGYGALLNAGAGATSVGQDCKLGGIISKSDVTVRHRATVYGDAVSGGKVYPDGDAVIVGAKTENATITLPALPTLPTFPSPTLSGFNVNSGQTVPKPAGSYSSQTSVNGGTLILQAGDYYFERLTINSGSVVRVTPTTRIFVRTALVFNASLLASSGSAVQPIYLGYAGTANLYMYAVFNGTLLAPNALVTFGTGSGLTFTGSFYGKAFEVTPDSKLACSM